MKFLIVLAIFALASPLYAQSEEKVIEKRGISYGLGGGLGHGDGLGHGGGLSSVSYSVPVVTKSIRISSGGYGGYGLGGHGLGGHGLGGLSRGHGGW
nr:acanthoscurrin-1-like [Bombus vancouverensis nearcticus]